jgi:propionate catabolism operon transcriptional regulator
MLAHHQYAPSHITRELIDDLKNTLHFNRDRIAAILGVSRTTLWRISNQSEEMFQKIEYSKVETFILAVP